MNYVKDGGGDAVHTCVEMLGRRGGANFLLKCPALCPICLTFLVVHFYTHIYVSMQNLWCESRAWVLLIHEKTRARKSHTTVPLRDGSMIFKNLDFLASPHKYLPQFCRDLGELWFTIHRKWFQQSWALALFFQLRSPLSLKIKEKIIFYKSYFLFICAKRIVLQIIISLSFALSLPLRKFACF